MDLATIRPSPDCQDRPRAGGRVRQYLRLSIGRTGLPGRQGGRERGQLVVQLQELCGRPDALQISAAAAPLRGIDARAMEVTDDIASAPARHRGRRDGVQDCRCRRDRVFVSTKCSALPARPTLRMRTLGVVFRGARCRGRLRRNRTLCVRIGAQPRSRDGPQAAGLTSTLRPSRSSWRTRRRTRGDYDS